MCILGGTLRGLAHLFLANDVASLHRELYALSSLYHRGVGAMLPAALWQALVAAEDHRFFVHPGVDLTALCRAVWQLLAHGRLQGASTIEQQLVRTVTRRYERTIRRKLREILMAACVEEVLTKLDTAGVYLMVAHYGWGMDGLGPACKSLHYELPSMSTYEAATLVARLKYPKRRLENPEHEAHFRKRVQHIIRLVSLGRGQLPEVQIEGEANAATV